MNDQAEFEADLAYMRSLGAAMLEHAGNRLAYPCEATVYERLKADISHEARRALFGPWQTFDQMWIAA
jgi:hypothetical protein